MNFHFNYFNSQNLVKNFYFFCWKLNSSIYFWQKVDINSVRNCKSIFVTKNFEDVRTERVIEESDISVVYMQV